MILNVSTRIDFIPGSDPTTFVDQAVKEQRRRAWRRRGRRFHSLIVAFAPGMAVRVNSAGTEIERLGDDESDN